MLKTEIEEILSASKEWGWVLEPEAKRLLGLVGLETTRFRWAHQLEDALQFAEEIGYPVVAKVVSPEALHKSDVDGVTVGITDAKMLSNVFERYSAFKDFSGVLVEEMVSGTELILGAKIDYQFGPVILLGIGGTGVEIYQDTTLRMAPLNQQDVSYMINGLKAGQLLKGYRGSEPVNMPALSSLIMTFSSLVMEIENWIESIDLNPVMCNAKRCVIADARIMVRDF
jgi:succinyl-CoA synthetase beta subunit